MVFTSVEMGWLRKVYEARQLAGDLCYHWIEMPPRAILGSAQKIEALIMPVVIDSGFSGDGLLSLKRHIDFIKRRAEQAELVQGSEKSEVVKDKARRDPMDLLFVDLPALEDFIFSRAAKPI